MPCCDVNGLSKLFRGPLVRLEKYHFDMRGPGKRQRLMLELCAPHSQGASILDIGCGIGALSLTALGRGAQQASLVDVSAAYLELAEDLARQRGLLEQTSFYQGDATTLELEPADIVLLDRVVCCYPDAEALLRFATHRSRRLLVFSYPQPSWLTRTFGKLLNTFMGLLGTGYQLYLHPPERLDHGARSSGYRLRHETKVGIWRIRAYAS